VYEIRCGRARGLGVLLEGVGVGGGQLNPGDGGTCAARAAQLAAAFGRALLVCVCGGERTRLLSLLCSLRSQ